MLSHLFAPIIGQGFPQAGTCRSVFVKPSRALRASVPSIRAKMTRRVVRSTSVPTAEPLPPPLIRSPAQWPGTVQVTTSAGRAAISPSCPRPTCRARLTPRRQQCAAQGSAWQHIQRRIDGLGREVSSHVVRIRAAKASGNLFGRAALGQVGPDILPQPRVEEFARSPASVPGWHDTGGPASRCAPTRGARCWARDPRPWPSRVANSLGRARGSGFHVLRHSCVCRISFAWQHRSPFGLVVVHLELELKVGFILYVGRGIVRPWSSRCQEEKCRPLSPAEL